MANAQQGIFGIDLGTTYSVVSYIDESGKPVISRNVLQGQDTTPSVVFFENESNVVVGAVAKESAILAPDQVVSLIKRQMGDRDYRYTLWGREYSAPEISAFILGALAKDAESETGRRVEKVVITVPAYFGVVEKEATRQAGEIAKLDVVGIVPEPVAAAFSYGLANEAENKTILVYDLGGGTFDVTIMKLTPESVDVVVVDGDHLLGGANWDETLFHHLSTQAVAELGDDTIMEDPQFVQELWGHAEEIKKRLSSTDSRSVILRTGGGSAKVTVTRQQFEDMTAHWLAETIDITKRALATAEQKEPGITAKISDVILVGGSSLMPAVASTLTKEFNWEPKLSDPHLAVAKGAALYAVGAVARKIGEAAAQAEVEAQQPGASAEELADAAPTEAQLEAAAEEVAQTYGIAPDKAASISKIEVTNVIPKAVGVKVIDDSVPNWREIAQQSGQPPFMIVHLVQPQTPLPFRPSEPFHASTVVANQPNVKVEIWEQAGAAPGPAVDENTWLADGTIVGLEGYALPQGSRIDIDFNVTEEGLVSVTATEATSGKRLTVEAKIALLSAQELNDAKVVYDSFTVGT